MAAARSVPEVKDASPQSAATMSFEDLMTFIKSSSTVEAFFYIKGDINLRNLINSEKEIKLIASINPAVAFSLLDEKVVPVVMSPGGLQKINQLFLLFRHNYDPIIFQKRLAEAKRHGLDLVEWEKEYNSKPKKSQDTRLDLATSYQMQDSTHSFSAKQRIDPFCNTSYAREQYIANTFMTTKSYFDQMMFGELGYYSTGKVDFENDFETFASDPETAEAFAGAFAFQLFKNWQQRELKAGEKFLVLECGAGNGNLCFNILSIAENMSLYNREWRRFYKALQYHIVERSPELVQQQKDKNREFRGKLRVIEKDARYLKIALNGMKMHVVFSNELLDVFPPQQLKQGQDGKIEVNCVIPYIALDFLRALISLDSGSYAELDRLKRSSDKHKKILKIGKDLDKVYEDESDDDEDDICYLSEADFLKLHKIAVSRNLLEMCNVFGFLEIYIDHEFFPEVISFLQRNPELMDRSLPEESRLACVGAYDFLNDVADVLHEQGEVITVDYGGNDNHLRSNTLRTYLGNKLDFNVYDKPSMKDITYDINFSTVARDGGSRLDPIFFGIQHEMFPIGCYLFLMLNPINNEEYLESDKHHLYLYKEEERVFYLIKGNEEKQYLKDAEQNWDDSSLDAKLFNSSKENPSKYSDVEKIKNVLDITSKQGHTSPINWYPEFVISTQATECFLIDKKDEAFKVLVQRKKSNALEEKADAPLALPYSRDRFFGEARSLTYSQLFNEHREKLSSNVAPKKRA